MLICDINGQRVLPDILELLEGAMTLGTTHATTRGAQEAATPPRALQPAEEPLPPHIPRVLVLKSEALAAHLAAGAAASEAEGATSAASAISAASAETTEQASPLAPAQPVGARILLVAFLAFLIARRLRSAYRRGTLRCTNERSSVMI